MAREISSERRVFPNTLAWVTRACPLCGSNEQDRVFAESNIDLNRLTEYAFASRKLPEYMHPRLVECSNCGLLYGNPVLSPDCLSVLYENAAFDSRQESQLASLAYKAIIQRYLSVLPDRIGAIDIGAGDGSFCERLLELGFSAVTGIEPSAAPIAAANPEIKKLLINRIFQAKDFAANSVSLITCFQVLEHLSNPQETVSAALDVLKPKGLFVAVAHNRHAFSARILGLKSPIYDVEHLQLFARKTGRRLLERAGFRGVRVFAIWNFYPVQYWMRLFPFSPRLKPGMSWFLKWSGLGTVRVSLPAGNIVLAGFKP